MDIKVHLQAVEAHEDFKVLYKAKRVPHFSEEPIDSPLKVLVVDTETTGTSSNDQIIENAGVMIEVCPATGRIGKVLAINEGLQEPTVPIDPAAEKVHGISFDMVKGKSIDKKAYVSLYSEADFVIAHNAQFDRPFIERDFSNAGLPLDKKWACSYREINWLDRGFLKSGLEYLVMSSGYFHGAHRAADDVFALIYCLAKPSDTHGYPLVDVLARLNEPNYMLKTSETFDFKDQLKARGYFYDPTDKTWCLLMHSNGDIQAEVKAEIKTLRDEIMKDKYGSRKGRLYFGKRDNIRKYTDDQFIFSEVNLETVKV